MKVVLYFSMRFMMNRLLQRLQLHLYYSFLICIFTATDIGYL